MTGGANTIYLEDWFKYRTPTVHCPRMGTPASILISKWRIMDGRWTNWAVINCSLHDARAISCDMDCLMGLGEDLE
jgi:hypothetical protein